jgi:uncharacterized protein (DUF1015 family)
MAEIEPFRAWRYNPEVGNIKDFTCPLFDVAEKDQVSALYQNPYNSIHLSQPPTISLVAEMIAKWKSEKIILQDPLPALYVYYQYYKIPTSEQLYCRKGFICNLLLHDWNENIVLRHENTMPHSVSDRLEVLEKTKMNISPTHGLYTDPDLILETYMDESIEKPAYEFTDYQGVINKLGIIQDLEVIKLFKKVLREKQIILADGHHRYTASLEFLKKNKNNLPDNSPNIYPWNYHCIYLTNTEANDITIYPTHRLIRDMPDFDQEGTIEKLKLYFSVKFIDNPDTIREQIAETMHSFGVLFKDQWLIITLKPGILKDLNWNFPDEVKNLDLTILHFFIIEKVLGIKGKEHKNSKNINFSFNFTKTVSETVSGLNQIGIITRKISMDEVKRICYSGFTFPHKSTYFYPKVVCGLLFHSIADQDFIIEQELYQKRLNV